jgi:hypothetical protein
MQDKDVGRIPLTLPVADRWTASGRSASSITQLTGTEVPEGARDAVALAASLHGNQLCNSRWSPP